MAQWKNAFFQGSFKLVCGDASQGWCLDLTANMMAKLPRELRDIIYTYILESRVIDHEHQELLVTTPSLWDLAEFSSSDHLWPKRRTILGDDVPHYVVYQHVDESFRIELAETLYRTKLLRVEWLLKLKAILHYDVFQTSCEPKDHMRNIQIELNFNFCTRTRDYYAEAVEPLWYLRHIKHIKGLKVGFVLNFKYDDVLPLIEEATAPLVQHLVSEGAKVTWYKKGCHVITGPTELVMPKRNFSDTAQESKDLIRVASIFGP
ncbi:hypothetical protein BKA58DRAFT_225928 [Alternaria rosae]|uniref:uncharacterized protein n=1 Tax=Alternaria rosae TaxID=1187941 RepID=UPI001E8E6E14|nr:uncharacterized protein BKA58DRAFT_225928 [Alternaria rosae]KAH6865695.1 hypothetical protein BKA58DRAFT_225928 [Alternaria rosae]